MNPFSYYIHNFLVRIGYIKVGHFITKVNNKKVYICLKCKVPAKYFDQHDLYACLCCDKWLEEQYIPTFNGKQYFSVPQTTPNGFLWRPDCAPYFNKKFSRKV
jgi:hypothetical protein